MRYFTRGWAVGDLTEEESDRASERYAARLDAIADRLSPPMARLRSGVSLHDALIESVRWNPQVAELRLTLVAGTLERGYHTVVLVYRGALLGVQRIESLRRAASNREACVLYNEIDVADDGTFVHRILFWPSEETTIDFRELEYLDTPRGDCRVHLAGAFVVARVGDGDGG